jgi:hypothetical protein
MWAAARGLMRDKRVGRRKKQASSYVSLHIHSICDVQELALVVSYVVLGYSAGDGMEHQT